MTRTRPAAKTRPIAIRQEHMKKLLSLVLCVFALLAATAAAADKPNILYILCDDLGYGDVKCLGGERSKIATPNLDRLAAQGMVFTEAHSSSAVCTPTRYGILTGRYNWRTHLQQGVLTGYSAPLIDKDRLTVPAFLKQHGYATACIGKWHLGMDISKQDPTAPVGDGPTTRGFDSYFGISASLDMPPFAFIENNRFTEAPTAQKKFVRMGAAAPGFDAADVLPTLAHKAAEYIAARAKEHAPFFLYLPLTSPHTPILPTKEWQGKSGLNAFGDFVMETDSAVGEVLAALDKAGIADNTLVMFTSDNGCSPSADFPKLLAAGHNPSYNMRGHKADIFDGGHRVPFIVRWPAKVKGGQTSAQIVCLTDFMATAAEAVGVKLPENAAEDSFSILPALLGESGKPVRQSVIHHSINGSFALREGDWKLELCAGSGGWSAPRPGSPGEKGLPDTQLYNLKTDIAEKDNLQGTNPEIVTKMNVELERIITSGRSTPGAAQQNAVPVIVRKSTPAAQPKAKKKAK